MILGEGGPRRHTQRPPRHHPSEDVGTRGTGLISILLLPTFLGPVGVPQTWRGAKPERNARAWSARPGGSTTPGCRSKPRGLPAFFRVVFVKRVEYVRAGGFRGRARDSEEKKFDAASIGRRCEV